MGYDWSSSDTAAAAQLASTAINYASAANTNKKQRKWSEDMYERQRADALADWQMQNDYNSPAANMKRLQAAGLNPNLVYGDGANMPSVQIRSSSVEGWHPQTPQVDLTGAVGSFLQKSEIQQRTAQVDNLKAQMDVLIQDAILRAAQVTSTVAQTAKTNVDTEQGKQNLDTAQKLQAGQLQMQQQQLEKLRADTVFTLNQDERAAALQQQSLQKGIEEILNLRAQRSQTGAQTDAIRQNIRVAQKDETLRQLDINLKQKGVQPGDPIYFRVLSQLVEAKDIKQAASAMLEKLKAVKSAADIFGITPFGTGK